MIAQLCCACTCVTFVFRLYKTRDPLPLDTPKWYRHADVFVYTSLSETYGQVVSEALWCGLPVVAFVDDKGVDLSRPGYDL